MIWPRVNRGGNSPSSKSNAYSDEGAAANGPDGVLEIPAAAEDDGAPGRRADTVAAPSAWRTDETPGASRPGRPRRRNAVAHTSAGTPTSAVGATVIRGATAASAARAPASAAAATTAAAKRRSGHVRVS